MEVEVAMVDIMSKVVVTMAAMVSADADVITGMAAEVVGMAAEAPAPDIDTRLLELGLLHR